MKVLITGATGSIGSFLVKDRLRRGDQVKCLIRKTSNLNKLENLPIELVYGSLLDKNSLVKAVKDVDIIYHLAAQTDKVDKETYDKINYLGTKNLAEACLSYNKDLKRFIHVSTIAVLGPNKGDIPFKENDSTQPISDYGRSKLAAENYIKELKRKLPFIIIRLPMVYGPGDKNLKKFIKLAKIGLWPSFFGKSSLASFLYIDDLTRGFNLIAENPKAKDKIYFLTEERFYKFEEIGKIIAKALGKKLIIIKVPKFLLLFLISIQELIFKLIGKKPLVLRSQIRRWASQDWICSGQKAKEELGFVTEIDFAEGVKKSLNG